MRSVEVTLTDSLRTFVDAEVATGRYRSTSDFILAVLRDAKKRRALERLEGQLLEGLKGKGTEATAEWWADFRRRLQARQRRRDRR